MNVIDFLALLTVVAFTLGGALRGFLKEAVGTVAWIVGLFAAWHFGHYLEPELGGELAQAAVRTWAARVIIVMLVLFLGAIIGTALSHYMELSMTTGLDRLLGGVFGTLRAFLLIGALVLAGQQLKLDGEHWWRQSTLMPYGATMANGVRWLVGEPLRRG